MLHVFAAVAVVGWCLTVTFCVLWLSTSRTNSESSRCSQPKTLTPVPRVALIVSGHLRQATPATSELRALQHILKQRFGCCDAFGVFPENTEMSTCSWYDQTNKAAVQTVDQAAAAGLCDFATLEFYNDVDLFSEVGGKWGTTRMDKRGLLSMWWAIHRGFKATVRGGYDWVIRLRPDNYKWDAHYIPQLKTFIQTFSFDSTTPGIVACAPTQLADDVCFAAPSTAMALFLTALRSNFDYWSIDERTRDFPEWVLREICRQHHIEYCRWNAVQ